MELRRVNARDVKLPSILMREMSDEEFQALVRSIAENGYVEPIQVVLDCDGKYRLLNGYHRFKALTEVFGVSDIDVVVVGRMCCEGDKPDESTASCWDELRFRIEAIRLNSIKGRWIKPVVVEAVHDILRQAERNGVPKSAVFEKLGAVGRSDLKRLLIEEQAKRVRRERDAVRNAVKRACIEIASEGYEQYGSFIVFTFRNKMVLVVPLSSKDEFMELASYLERIDADYGGLLVFIRSKLNNGIVR
ncbi:MAG: ParB N-terminal domain-containing protein [Ignisphaera sp.]|uniref:ParB N-terminal domain-containing protein n=1 Tax=Thermofilum sp. TaxID=1961369 RepID=UPI003163A20D